MKKHAAFLGAMILSGTAAAAAPNWEGPYAGLQAGYVWGNLDQYVPGYFGAEPEGDVDGFILGGFAGYNMNISNLVLGFEAGANWSDAEGDNDINNNPEKLSTDQEWDASVVLKLGVPVNNYLVYGLAGAAWTEVTSQYTGAPDASDTVYGWTVGAGVQTQFGNQLSGRMEYRYTDYDDANVTCSSCGPTSVELDTHTLTVGVAMHF